MKALREISTDRLEEIGRKPILTLDETADLLRCSRTTVLSGVRTGSVPALRLSPRKLRFSRAAIEALAGAPVSEAV